MTPSFRKMNFGERLKFIRKSHNQSASECADTIGIAKGHVHELERGESANPTLKVVLAISKEYDISVGKLLEGLEI